MIKSSGENFCLEASRYYYDYIDGDRDNMPSYIYDHISLCEHCGEKMEMLQSALENSKPEAGLLDLLKTSNLELQFSLLEKGISCSDTKAFLPLFASKDFAVSIQTPITLHIENCSNCRESIEQLRQLSLPDKKLFVLGRLIVSDCRSPEIISGELDIDIFTAHKVIGAISKPDSGVVTSLKKVVDSDGNAEFFSEVNEADSAFVKKAFTKGSSFKTKLGIFIKPFAAAAAVLLVAGLMFINTRSATALGLKDIYKAFEQIKYVYIQDYDQNQSLLQEKWAAESENMVLVKSSDSATLFDIASGQKISKEDQQSLKIAELNKAAGLYYEDSFQAPWGLMPFRSFQQVPDGAVYTELKDSASVKGKKVKLYAISWSENRSDATQIYKKWLGFIDSETGLPLRIEWYRKYALDQEYELVSQNTLNYISHDQFDSVLDKEGFDR